LLLVPIVSKDFYSLRFIERRRFGIIFNKVQEIAAL
jgi:hypothetical protein